MKLTLIFSCILWLAACDRFMPTTASTCPGEIQLSRDKVYVVPSGFYEGTRLTVKCKSMRNSLVTIAETGQYCYTTVYGAVSVEKENFLIGGYNPSENIKIVDKLECE